MSQLYQIEWQWGVYLSQFANKDNVNYGENKAKTRKNNEKECLLKKKWDKILWFQKFAIPLHSQNRDLAQLVAHTSGGREVAGSSPVIPTNANRKCLIFKHFLFFNRLSAQILHKFSKNLHKRGCPEGVLDRVKHLPNILNIFGLWHARGDVNPSSPTNGR